MHCVCVYRFCCNNIQFYCVVVFANVWFFSTYKNIHDLMCIVHVHLFERQHKRGKQIYYALRVRTKHTSFLHGHFCFFHKRHFICMCVYVCVAPFFVRYCLISIRLNTKIGHAKHQRSEFVVTPISLWIENCMFILE